MATFKLFSPAIINNSPIILIKFYDEKHLYKIILCEFLLNNNAVLNTSVVWKRLEGGNMCQKFEGFKLLHLHSAHRKSLDAVCKKKAAITKVNGKLLEDLLGSCSAAASDLCQGSRTNLQSIKAVAPPVTVWCRWNRWLIFIYVVKKVLILYVTNQQSNSQITFVFNITCCNLPFLRHLHYYLIN